MNLLKDKKTERKITKEGNIQSVPGGMLHTSGTVSYTHLDVYKRQY